ncbi:protein yellow-like [Agrilus planipennis]|uniref:Protein yellow-like n=1 Tax=Agrilus planipennis TaxID=224129 RepID=A0A1W4WJT7_AGRPL|nr:protein yellow-like [Agrilus planipennis]
MGENIQQWDPSRDLFYGSRTTEYTTAADNHRNLNNGGSYHKYLPFFLALNLTQPYIYNIQNNNHNLISSGETHTLFPHHYPIEPSYPHPLEQTGAFKTWYRWKQIDFLFPSEQEKYDAISSGKFIQENVLPLGVETYKDRIFVTCPKWKTGIPYTLAVLPKIPQEESPLLVPYPSWNFHRTGSCTGLTSAFRMIADVCGRLWVLDSGLIEISTKPIQVCPPTIFIFDLNTDYLIHRYELPEEFIKQDSLYSNLIVDIRRKQCDDAYAYITDVWRFGLVVFSLKNNKSWRVTDHLFFPDPLAAAFNIHGIDFEWTDGIFSLALSPENPNSDDRILFFHPMSSFREFYVPTSVIRNETGWMTAKESFKILGQSRGINGHASGAGMDRKGVLFYNLISKDGVACWDSHKPYTRSNLGILVHNSETMFFPNDMRMDREEDTSVWILTNRLPAYLYRSLNKHDYNFRIISAYVDEAIEGTVCDPEINHSEVLY